MDTNIVHESMGLASPGLYFMLCKRLLVTNVTQVVAGEQGRERMNLPSALFHLKRLEWGCFNFRNRAFFLTNDGDNLSGIELVLLSGFPQSFFFFFMAFPSVSWSLGPSGLIEQSRRDCEPVSPHGAEASVVFALLWVCADACGHIVIHRGWEWDRVLILLSLVENDLIPLETGVEATNPREFAGAGVPEISWGWEEKRHNTWKPRRSSRMLNLDGALEPREGRPGTRVTAVCGVV